MSKQLITIAGLRRAVEARDAAALKSLYSDDAVLTIIDAENPPSAPRKITGAQSIGEFIDDVYGRDMTHSVESGVMDERTLAFVEGCQYGDGTRVIASNMAELGPRGIVRHVIVQAWDS